jgi:hypothetical protein
MSSTDLTQLDPETKAQYKRRMQRDPWYFAKYVYGLPNSRIRLQRPLLYLYTRQAELLAACLSDPQYDVRSLTQCATISNSTALTGPSPPT